MKIQTELNKEKIEHQREKFEKFKEDCSIIGNGKD